MLHLIGFVVLVTFAAGANAACDLSALSTCVTAATPTDNSGGGNTCDQYNAIMTCVTKYNATCTNEVKSYTSNLGPLVNMCGGGMGGGGGGQGDGCDMAALSACMSTMQSVQGIVSGDSPPTGADLKQVCDGYKTFQSCIADLPPACKSVFESNKMAADQMGQMVSQYCGGDGCDMIGVQTCMVPMQGLNFNGESVMSSLVSVSGQCAQLEGVMNCLQPKLEGCKDNKIVQNTTALLDQMKMMINFVCQEKQQAIMELAACAGKPAALQKLSECEANHPMSSDPTKESKEQLCTEVNTMSSCLETATSGVFSSVCLYCSEVNTMSSCLETATSGVFS
ncbi:uncharacterized protein LOC117339969 isoform X2 [Pecten maximus]|uniref:uncharacterized protein LOC117339969 isoform X2 n=2 Tax=Pecten maximus TaxID=6579 RepID=UPI0014591694|nr:uncharacterized protein LOC117339969 isoform X2 [Pecten maximus]